MNGVMADSVSAGSSQREAMVMWAPIVTWPSAARATAGAPAASAPRTSAASGRVRRLIRPSSFGAALAGFPPTTLQWRRFTSLVRREGRDTRDVRIEDPDACLHARSRGVPDAALARDRQLGLVGDLRRGIEGERPGLRVEADERAALTAVTDPDVVVAIGPHIIRLRVRHR